MTLPLEQSASTAESRTQKSYQERLKQVIPGGAHTYSRGSDQFPQNTPEILRGGKGVYVQDADGNEFLDRELA